MNDIAFASATKLAAMIRQKKISSAELLELYLKRVEAYNPALNAIVVQDVERARKDAALLDRRLARGDIAGPLHGVPMTVKESFNVQGLPTTWGDPAYKDTVAKEDALAVSRLRSAGAVIFGKSNVPLMLADWQSYNAVYGTTNNPWDPTRTPGGSSGGSAAALAAGLTGLEIGSDIGSSIRNPAHYCGVYGHKPSFGICSPRGQSLGTIAPSDISVIGPLARSGADLMVALDVMAGPDDIDAAGWKLTLPKPRLPGIKGMRIAIMANDPVAPVDEEYAGKIEALARPLKKEGARVDLAARPEIDKAELWKVYVLLLRAATSARLSPEQIARWTEEAAKRGEDADGYIALMARGNTLPHRVWLQLNEVRHRMRQAWAAFFREWDVLLCPVAAGTAFPHDHEGERQDRVITVNGEPQPTTTQLFWAGISGVCYLPAAVAPIGLAKGGLPLGVQIIAGPYQDRAAIHLATLMEKAVRGFRPPPGYEADTPEEKAEAKEAVAA
ncbi:amidase [Elioraea sp.]|uniref:amidase n=1 Tax=Elioraea sp. TaxID=2185103 RepID=UPI003F721B30